MLEAKNNARTRRNEIAERKAQILGDQNYFRHGTPQATALREEMLNLSKEQITLDRQLETADFEANEQEKQQQAQQQQDANTHEQRVLINKYEAQQTAPAHLKRDLANRLPKEHVNPDGSLNELGRQHLAQLHEHIRIADASTKSPEELKTELQRNEYLKAVERNDFERANTIRDVIATADPSLADDLPRIETPNPLERQAEQADAIRQQHAQQHPSQTNDNR